MKTEIKVGETVQHFSGIYFEVLEISEIKTNLKGEKVFVFKIPNVDL